DAKFDTKACDHERLGVIIGSGIGGLPLIEEMHTKMLERGPSRVSPFFIPGLIINLAAGQISIRFNCKGPSSAPATACATGAHAIGDAFKVIQRDDADVMFAGGTEAVITPLAVGGFGAMRALSTRNDDPQHASRPWDLNRDGFVMGEGAGVLLGAAGGLEAAICALALKQGILPPTINLETPDPDCDLDYVPNQARPKQVRHVLSNSFGFGGTNATLVFSAYE